MQPHGHSSTTDTNPSVTPPGFQDGRVVESLASGSGSLVMLHSCQQGAGHPSGRPPEAGGKVLEEGMASTLQQQLGLSQPALMRGRVAIGVHLMTADASSISCAV
jgi:hypothetical protein